MLRMSRQIVVVVGAVLGALLFAGFSVADDKNPPVKKVQKEAPKTGADETRSKPAAGSTNPIATFFESIFGGSGSQTADSESQTADIEAEFFYDAAAEEKKIAEQRAEIIAQGTHEQTKVITVADERSRATWPLMSMSVAKNGDILAGVGTQQGRILVMSADGEPKGRWSLPVVPEAIHTTPRGDILVAGDGRLLKLDANGKVLVNKPAPHVSSSDVDKKRLRAQVKAQLKQNAQIFGQQIETYEKMIVAHEGAVKALTDKGTDTLSFAEKQRLTTSKRAIANLKTSMETLKTYMKQNPTKEPTEQDIDRQLAMMTRSTSKVSSISSQGENVFVACRAKVGYGFDVWRMDPAFAGAKKIVTGLRGCCGQMDVQCCEFGLFVAENARHRVVRYDANGKLLNTWGKRAREGLEGFGSCCNPMNVAFGPGGEIYTAESYTGRVKRFDAKGKLLGVVGSGEIGSGCVNVSIRVSDDGNRVYMMNSTESKIVLLTRKAETKAERKAKTKAAATGATKVESVRK